MTQDNLGLDDLLPVRSLEAGLSNLGRRNSGVEEFADDVEVAGTSFRGVPEINVPCMPAACTPAEIIAAAMPPRPGLAAPSLLFWRLLGLGPLRSRICTMGLLSTLSWRGRGACACPLPPSGQPGLCCNLLQDPEDVRFAGGGGGSLCGINCGCGINVSIFRSSYGDGLGLSKSTILPPWVGATLPNLLFWISSGFEGLLRSFSGGGAVGAIAASGAAPVPCRVMASSACVPPDAIRLLRFIVDPGPVSACGKKSSFASRAADGGPSIGEGSAVLIVVE